LADPARVKIMSLLFSSSAGEENSGDLAAALSLSESTVSHHLTQLRNAGLVESERRGMNVYHRPTVAPSRRCALCSIPTAAAKAAVPSGRCRDQMTGAEGSDSKVVVDAIVAAARASTALRWFPAAVAAGSVSEPLQFLRRQRAVQL
jgi:DNA-binding transcriptional ArsR family regulator